PHPRWPGAKDGEVDGIHHREKGKTDQAYGDLLAEELDRLHTGPRQVELALQVVATGNSKAAENAARERPEVIQHWTKDGVEPAHGEHLASLGAVLYLTANAFVDVESSQ